MAKFQDIYILVTEKTLAELSARHLRLGTFQLEMKNFDRIGRTVFASRDILAGDEFDRIVRTAISV